MTTFIAWIVVFGVLVAVHELGHFLMAKSLDMRVNEYSLGFGPLMLAKRWGETQYSIRIIPLGGYVRLAGMEGDKSEDPREYPNRPLWQRFVVVLAGPVMNLVLAAALYAVLFGPVGWPVGTTTIQNSLPSYPAYTAGIRSGDRIVAIDKQPIHSWSQVKSSISEHVRQPMRITVMRRGQPHTFTVRTRLDPRTHQYIIGIQPKTRLVHESIGQALLSGIGYTIRLTGLWFQTLANLFTGRGGFSVTGPVGIAVMVGQAAQAGMFSLILLSAGLSANLGLFNILPIPVLDGSRLFLLALEGVRRRAMDPNRESLIHFVGLVVLLVFVVFVTYHDIVHYFHIGAFG